MTQHSNLSLRAARDTAARVNGTTVHNAPHPAAQLKQPLPAADKRWSARLAALAAP